MENPDLRIIRALVESFDGGGGSFPRTPECPDDMDLFGLLEDEEDYPPELRGHVTGCRYCMKRLVELSAVSVTGPDDRDFIEERLPFSDEQPEEDGLILEIMSGRLIAKQNPYSTTTAYRDNEAKTVVIEKEAAGLRFCVEFILSEDGNKVSILFELQAKGGGDVEIGLWENDRLLRSFSVVKGIKQTFSKWGRSRYELKVSEGGRIVDTIPIGIK